MAPGDRSEAEPRPRLLVGASGGGHWIELLRLRPAFEDFEIVYVSTFEGYAHVVAGHRYYTVPETSRFRVRTLIPAFFRAAQILWKERPSVILTTGSAPMLPFIVFGRLFAATTIWIDSIANADHLSTSGRIAKHFADRCLAQWPNVASDEDIECWGKII